LSQCVQSMTPNKLWDYVEKHLDGCCVLWIKEVLYLFFYLRNLFRMISVTSIGVLSQVSITKS
jgi:hypothetical protein